jgi:hypothetical protein
MAAEDDAMPPKVAALLAAAGALCILLSTFFGVSDVSDWLIFATQIFFAVGFVVFAAYIVDGIIRDANAV